MKPSKRLPNGRPSVFLMNDTASPQAGHSLAVSSSSMKDSTATQSSGQVSLAVTLLDQVDEIVRQAEQATTPLEVDPYRGRLFELFVTADGAGYLDEEADHDLTADGLCHQLAQRWGLKQAAEQSFAQQASLPATQLQKMRSLWSVMRMWMEWTYAWRRWDEFHRAT